MQSSGDGPQTPDEARAALRGAADIRNGVAAELDRARVIRDDLVTDVMERGLLSKAEVARWAQVSRSKLYPKY